jgi:hypothetical protein
MSESKKSSNYFKDMRQRPMSGWIAAPDLRRGGVHAGTCRQ